MKHIVVAITGASGAVYALRLLRALLVGGHRVGLVISKYGRFLLQDETDFEPSKEKFSDFLIRLYGNEVTNGILTEHNINDLSATLASGSVKTDGMVVVPCSAKTLSAIACGSSSTLLERAADVTLKEGKPLIIVPRETPMNLIQLRNMVAVAEAGARVVPAMPAFYQKPRTFDDLGDFIAGRVLSLLGIEHKLYPEWHGSKSSGE